MLKGNIIAKLMVVSSMHQVACFWLKEHEGNLSLVGSSALCRVPLSRLHLHESPAADRPDHPNSTSCTFDWRSECSTDLLCEHAEFGEDPYA